MKEKHKIGNAVQLEKEICVGQSKKSKTGQPKNVD